MPIIRGVTRPARLSDYVFAQRYLTDTPLFPADSAARWFEPALFHNEHSHLADHTARLIVRRFRDSGKSLQFTLIRPIRLICENRNIRIVVISKIKDIASRFVDVVGKQLRFNEKIIRDFGIFYTDEESWTREAFTVQRAALFKEPTFQAVGRGGQIVSGRYELVILDDCEDFESTRNDTRRAGTFNWFQRDVIPVVVPGGQIIIIQTPQHEADLVGQVQKQRIWKVVTTPAEVEDEKQPGRIKRVATWPGKFPIYWQSQNWGTPCEVEKVEARGGSKEAMATAATTACSACPVYNSEVGDNEAQGCLTGKRYSEIDEVAYVLQYLCDLTALKGSIFKPEWFRYYYRDEITWKDGQWWYLGPGQLKPYRIHVKMGIDPAIKKDEIGPDVQEDMHSKFAVVVLGWIPPLRRRLLLDFYNQRITYPEQIEVAVEFFTTWHPEEIIVEETGYQAALRQHLAAAHRLPIRGESQDVDKLRRFVALSPEIRAGNLYLLARKEERDGQTVTVYPQEEFQNQFTTFPNGSFVDLLDAYDLAQRYLNDEERMLAEFVPKATSDPEDSPHVRPPTPPSGGWTVRGTLEDLGLLPMP